MLRRGDGFLLPIRKEGEGVMKITLMRNTVINGEPVATGQTVEIDQKTGRYLVNIGKAFEAESETKKRTATSKQASQREKRQ